MEAGFQKLAIFLKHDSSFFFSHNFKSQVSFGKFIQNVNFSFFNLDFM